MQVVASSGRSAVDTFKSKFAQTEKRPYSPSRLSAEYVPRERRAPASSLSRSRARIHSRSNPRKDMKHPARNPQTSVRLTEFAAFQSRRYSPRSGRRRMVLPPFCFSSYYNSIIITGSRSADLARSPLSFGSPRCFHRVLDGLPPVGRKMRAKKPALCTCEIA